MLFKVKKFVEVEVNLKFVDISVPVRYEEEDIPNDFPFRKNDMWNIRVEIATGRIVDWPEGYAAHVHMKVTDCGIYTLIDADGKEFSKIDEDYVPHGVVPGEWGDYIVFDINADGIIKNWPASPDISDFNATATS